jgi:cation diffusion facilitator CzcD-associated flavoprotein CzcO
MLENAHFCLAILSYYRCIFLLFTKQDIMAIPRLFQLSMQLRSAEDQEREQNGSAEPTYKMNEQPLGTASKIRIITIGAGASGLNVIRTLRKQLTNYEHVIYEKNPKVGGTWYENRYPGCKCDIPSHNYQFSWKPNHGWSSFFSPAEEIEAYLCRLYAEEDIQHHIKLEHEVVGAYWNENSGQWKVSIKNLKMGNSFEDHCEFLLNASGILK